jgi:hypothetical protein
MFVLRAPQTVDAVDQERLEMVVSLENQIESLRSVHDKYCSEILEALLSGRTVQPGVHSAMVRQRVRGARKEFRLWINGRKCEV